MPVSSVSMRYSEKRPNAPLRTYVCISWALLPKPSLLTLHLCSQAGPADLKHFDPEFTQEAVSKSIGCTPDTMASSSGASSAFLGFSYAPDDEAILDG